MRGQYIDDTVANLLRTSSGDSIKASEKEYGKGHEDDDYKKAHQNCHVTPASRVIAATSPRGGFGERDEVDVAVSAVRSIEYGT